MTGKPFPKVVGIIGWPFAGAAAFLAGRLVWEQTVWTWERGPQMVGFSLAHSGSGILLLFALYAGVIWLIAAGILAYRSRSLGGPTLLIPLTIYALAWIVVSIPYGFWQRIFADRLANGPYAAEVVTYAAARGDIGTVRAFVNRGVSVSVRTADDGTTPLHAAAVEGQLEVIQYLLSKGAEVNAVNRRGNSPLVYAKSANHPAAAKLLADNGGEEIRRVEVLGGP